MNIQSDSGRRLEAPNVGRWWELYSTALEQQGRDPRVGSLVVSSNRRAWSNLKALMDDIGFVNTKEEQHRLPIGEWSQGENVTPSMAVGMRSPWLTRP